MDIVGLPAEALLPNIPGLTSVSTVLAAAALITYVIVNQVKRARLVDDRQLPLVALGAGPVATLLNLLLLGANTKTLVAGSILIGVLAAGVAMKTHEHAEKAEEGQHPAAPDHDIQE